MNKTDYSSNSFVLRIWWEEGGALPVWRGWVQYAASGEDRYFDRLADLLVFIERYTGLLHNVETAYPKPTTKTNIER